MRFPIKSAVLLVFVQALPDCSATAENTSKTEATPLALQGAPAVDAGAPSSATIALSAAPVGACALRGAGPLRAVAVVPGFPGAVVPITASGATYAAGAPINLPPNSGPFVGVTCADLNGDGVDEVVAVNAQAALVLYVNGGPLFQAGILSPPSGTAFGATARGDIFGLGHDLPMLSVTGTAPNVANVSQPSFAQYLQSVTVVEGLPPVGVAIDVAAPLAYETPESPYGTAVVATDVDGDGHPDLVAVGPTDPTAPPGTHGGTLSVAYGLGNEAFLAPVLTPVQGTNAGEGGANTSGIAPFGSGLGRSIVAAMDIGEGFSSLYLVQPDAVRGTFARAPDLQFTSAEPVFDDPIVLASGDFDGDGVIDTYVQGSGYSERLLADGPSVRALGAAPTTGFLAVGDVDADGAADFMYAASSQLVVSFAHEAAPSITAVAPAVVPASGGATLTATGAHIPLDARVTIGGVRAPATAIATDGTSITVTVPPGLAVGTADIVVTVPGGAHATLAHAVTIASGAGAASSALSWVGDVALTDDDQTPISSASARGAFTVGADVYPGGVPAGEAVTARVSWTTAAGAVLASRDVPMAVQLATGAGPYKNNSRWQAAIPYLPGAVEATVTVRAAVGSTIVTAAPNAVTLPTQAQAAKPLQYVGLQCGDSVINTANNTHACDGFAFVPGASVEISAQVWPVTLGTSFAATVAGVTTPALMPGFDAGPYRSNESFSVTVHPPCAASVPVVLRTIAGSGASQTTTVNMTCQLRPPGTTGAGLSFVGDVGCSQAGASLACAGGSAHAGQDITFALQTYPEALGQQVVLYWTLTPNGASAPTSVYVGATWTANGAGPYRDNSAWTATVPAQFVQAGSATFFVEATGASGEDVLIGGPENGSTGFGLTIH